jgi:lambda repressor-like predicted transcriptional regulator
MSDALQPTETAFINTEQPPDMNTDLGADTAYGEYIENASRYDGSRTAPHKVALIHELKRAGRSVNAICQILGMDNRTVNAVLARQDHLIADARMLLRANALGFAADAIQASRVAAEKGKIEGISAMLDRLDVTQPPKGQQGSQVAVQINLHGGPEPVSLAKVQVQSEGVENQAGNGEGLIMQLMDTAQPTASIGVSEPSIHQAQPTTTDMVANTALIAEVRKQA